MVHYPGERNSKKSFFFCVSFPNLAKIPKICECCLYSSKYRCQSGFSTETVQAIFWSDHNFTEVTKLLRPKNDFRTGVSSVIMFCISASTPSGLFSGSHTVKDTSLP